jgi:hypothetical protein
MATVDDPAYDARRESTLEAARSLQKELGHGQVVLEGGDAVDAVLWAWMNEEASEPAGLFEAIKVLAAFHRPNYFDESSGSLGLIVRASIDVLKQCHWALQDIDGDNTPNMDPGGDLPLPVRYARIAALEDAHRDLGHALEQLKADAAATVAR